MRWKVVIIGKWEEAWYVTDVSDGERNYDKNTEEMR